ncbi:MAG: rRNA pseudouridine synthase [Oligoflexales bacterium]|nr:rRNA pseudouridine synthase [Oligoflexales bacterium]
MIRLQKWIAELGIASRREAEEWLKEGRLTVNSEPASIGHKIDPEKDRVYLDGKSLTPKKAAPKVYWLFHKPEKMHSARNTQEETQPSIFSLPSLRKIKFTLTPIDKLDYLSSGLMLLTSDRDLASVAKRYMECDEQSFYVLLNQKLRPDQINKIRAAAKKQGEKTSAKIQFIRGQKIGKMQAAWYDLTIKVPSLRALRQLFRLVEVEIKGLTRYRVHSFYLPDSLKPGEYIQLTAKQIQHFKETCAKHEELD